MNSFKRPKTAQEAVLLEIRQRLRDRRLSPGSAIRPDAIGAELGVSAVPVREALRILEGEGHVEYRPHRGYMVAELDIDDLTEIYRIRELLENEAVRGAAGALGPDHLAELHGLIAEMAEVDDDVTALTAVNRRFHFTVFEAAGMLQTLRVLRILWDASDRYRSRYLSRPENRQLALEQHQRIVAGLTAGDLDKVIEEMRLHREQAVAALAMLGLSSDRP